MTQKLRLTLAMLLLPLALGGCTALSALGEASQPLEIYELRAAAPEQTAARRRNLELVVEEPVATGALATERIMIQPGALQVQYLPGVRWADPAPAMLQTLLLRSLAETGALASVGRRPVGSRGDFAMLSELTDFQAETRDDRDGASISVRLMVRIVREGDARVVATRTFAAREEAMATDADTIVAAFDRATARLLSEIVPWILERTPGSA